MDNNKKKKNYSVGVLIKLEEYKKICDFQSVDYKSFLKVI